MKRGCAPARYSERQKRISITQKLYDRLTQECIPAGYKTPDRLAVFMLHKAFGIPFPPYWLRRDHPLYMTKVQIRNMMVKPKMKTKSFCEKHNTEMLDYDFGWYCLIGDHTVNKRLGGPDCPATVVKW